MEQLTQLEKFLNRMEIVKFSASLQTQDMKLKKYRQFGLHHYQLPYDNMPNPSL